MKTFLLTALLGFLMLTFAACESFRLPPDTAERVGNTIERTVEVVDRDRDGYVTNAELKNAEGNVALWGALITGILGLLGGGTYAASKRAGTAQAQVDELYDRTHVPVVPPKQ